jgi:hypothetical protein
MSLFCSVLLAVLAPQDTQPATRAQQPPPPPMPVPVVLARHRGGRPMRVDADLADWPAAMPARLDDPRQVSGSALNAWHSPGDLSAIGFFVWDETDLYFAMKVRDDWHRPLGPDSPRVTEVPPADAIVLTFDPNRDTRSWGRDLRREEDREFWLADVPEQGRKFVLWDRFRGNARYAEGDAALAVSRDGREGITTYEVRIPWTEILPSGRRLRRGDVLRAEIVASDFDEVTDIMPQTRVGWTFGSGVRVWPGVMGSIVLGGDHEQAEVEIPEVPPPPQAASTIPPANHWLELQRGLQQHGPRVAVWDQGPPAAAGGAERQRLLAELDLQLAAYPRVDFLEFQYRLHRRMRREAEGFLVDGLPWFWNEVLADVGRRVAGPPPERGFRIFRLPQGGWLVRSAVANFGIDVAGYDLEKHVWGALDFVLLTSPLDVGKRNDQVLVRAGSAKRLICTHIALHLPGVDASRMELVKPGNSYDVHGLKVQAIGRTDPEGRVTTTLAYLVTWPDGTRLLHSGQSLRVEDAPAPPPCDLLLVSAMHPQAAALAQKLAPRLAALDDVLQCVVGRDPRRSLRDAYELQTQMRPVPTLLLAPGDAWDVAAPAGRSR